MDKNILQGLADNTALLNAIKAVIDSKFALDDVNTGMQNEAIGQVVRANIEGRARVEEAFKEILSHKSPPATTGKKNPAR